MSGGRGWGGKTLSFIWNQLSLGSRLEWKYFYTRNVDMAYNTSENRMLARLLIGKLGKLDMHHPDAVKWWRRGPSLSNDVSFALDQQNERNNTSATPSTYPSTCLAFFVSS